MAQSEFKIEKAFLERLERLTIHWQKSFPGIVGGHNSSRFSGPGQEFLDHRNFTTGDDLRAVNWRAYMRLEKLFLKMFQIEPRVPIRIFLDASESMGLGNKWDYARRLVAAITYVGLVRLDAMQLIPFREEMEEGLSCGGGRHRFSPVADYLRDLKPGGKTDFARVSREFLSASRQRGLVIIVSDFLGEDDWLRPLQFMADFGHELTLIQVWDDEDRSPSAVGDLEVTEVESGKQVKISFDEKARAQYTASFDAYSEELRRLALRNEGRYSGLPTSTSVEDAVFGSLIAAQGLR
ncbi:DUF58 domain-containing protein [Bryobacter aggregatus]|uniref:DUF58 domain-containing protein n=1 Tax=Bryobacter aggregatus TaxID=360054 RepID=UPI001EE34BAF|nr:DUF58 domain-containing protein [Bryobacter aggregatus]